MYFNISFIDIDTCASTILCFKIAFVQLLVSDIKNMKRTNIRKKTCLIEKKNYYIEDCFYKKKN
jgi:hypothetical protein